MPTPKSLALSFKVDWSQEDEQEKSEPRTTFADEKSHVISNHAAWACVNFGRPPVAGTESTGAYWQFTFNLFSAAKTTSLVKEQNREPIPKWRRAILWHNHQYGKHGDAVVMPHTRFMPSLEPDVIAFHADRMERDENALMWVETKNKKDSYLRVVRDHTYHIHMTFSDGSLLNQHIAKGEGFTVGVYKVEDKGGGHFTVNPWWSVTQIKSDWLKVLEKGPDAYELKTGIIEEVRAEVQPQFSTEILATLYETKIIELTLLAQQASTFKEANDNDSLAESPKQDQKLTSRTPRKLRPLSTAPAVITVTLSPAEEAQESMDNLSTKIKLVTTVMDRIYEKLQQEIDGNISYSGYKPWQNGGNERKTIDNLKEKFSQQVQQKFSALAKDLPEKKLELLPALLLEAKTIEESLAQKESALEEAYSNCQRSALRERGGQAKQKGNYKAPLREEKKKNEKNEKKKKETPQEKAERIANWKAKQKKEADNKKKMASKTEIKTPMPVSVVSKQEKRDNTVRIAALNTVVRQLRLLSLCLAHYAAEENRSREAEYVRRDNFIRHFALQRYLLGCIHALKIYKNYGGISSSQLEEKKLEDQRNMLIHADWVATDEQTIYESFQATLETAETYNKYLPEELLKTSHPVELKDLPCRAIVQLMRTFKVEIADTYEVEPYPLVIENTPLYKIGKKYDESGRSLTLKPEEAHRALYETYLPLLKELMMMFNKHNIHEKGESWMQQYFYFPLDAARMLLSICGELAPVCTDPELKPFVTRCRDVRNHVAHSFTEKVSTSDILSLLDKRSLPEKKAPVPANAATVKLETKETKETQETKTNQLRATAPSFTYNPPAKAAPLVTPPVLIAPAPAAPIMSIVPPPPIIPPFIPGLVMSPYPIIHNPMLNFPVAPYAPPLYYPPPYLPPNMNQFFYPTSNPVFGGAALSHNPSHRRSGI